MMLTKCPYVMREQVKDLIPNLMETDIFGAPKKNTSFRELTVFSIVLGCYLLLLGLTSS